MEIAALIHGGLELRGDHLNWVVFAYDALFNHDFEGYFKGFCIRESMSAEFIGDLIGTHLLRGQGFAHGVDGERRGKRCKERISIEQPSEKGNW